MILAPSAALFLAFLQMRSAWAKLRQPEVFRSIWNAYPFAARFGRLPMVKLVPLLELALTAGLLLPFPLLRLVSCGCLFAFITTASAAIYARYHRGELRFACGCSGNLEEQTPVPAMLIRNGLLVSVTLYAGAGSTQSGSGVDYAIGLALLLAFDLFFATLIQEGRVQSWMEPGSPRS